jgi:hydroxyacylglutathione hydrolase
MKVTDTIHAIKHNFRLPLGNGRFVDRFVYSYILCGEKVCLIDAGVSATIQTLLDYLKTIGRSPQEVSMVLLTHAHPDHIGGCVALKKASSPSFAVHSAEKSWVEDVQKQHRERPTGNFFELVEGPVSINMDLKDGQVISWDRGKTIKVYETPGHSSGSVSFFYEQEGALFTGDAVPAWGAIPIYVDPQALIKSIRKLQKISGVKHLFSSWHEPLSGAQIAATMEESIRYIERIDEVVKDLMKKSPPATSAEDLSLRALETLGIKMEKVLPIVVATFKAHMKK